MAAATAHLKSHTHPIKLKRRRCRETTITTTLTLLDLPSSFSSASAAAAAAPHITISTDSSWCSAASKPSTPPPPSDLKIRHSSSAMGPYGGDNFPSSLSKFNFALTASLFNPMSPPASSSLDDEDEDEADEEVREEALKSGKELNKRKPAVVGLSFSDRLNATTAGSVKFNSTKLLKNLCEFLL